MSTYVAQVQVPEKKDCTGFLLTSLTEDAFLEKQGEEA